MTYPYTLTQNKINLPNNRSPMVDRDLTPTNEWQKWFNNIQIALNTYASITFGDSVPTSGTYAKGNIIFNSAPTPGGKIGWVCTTSGTASSTPGPGIAVFKEWGPIDA